MSERPIVAELGRPETPEEKADRLAASRAKRRGNQTSKNLLLSLAASLGIVLFLIVVVVRPDPAPEPVDYQATAAEAEASLGSAVIAPSVPPSWIANRADLSGSGGVQEWYVGFTVDQAGFIAILQGFDANPTWLQNALRDPAAGDTVAIGNTDWTRYDRRGVESAGLREYALVTETAHSTIVLYGTASDDDFALLATAVAAELPIVAD
jgi:hypothetical protein